MVTVLLLAMFVIFVFNWFASAFYILACVSRLRGNVSGFASVLLMWLLGLVLLGLPLLPSVAKSSVNWLTATMVASLGVWIILAVVCSFISSRADAKLWTEGIILGKQLQKKFDADSSGAPQGTEINLVFATPGQNYGFHDEVQSFVIRVGEDKFLQVSPDEIIAIYLACNQYRRREEGVHPLLYAVWKVFDVQLKKPYVRQIRHS